MATEAKAAVSRYRMFIGGEFTQSHRGGFFPVEGPSTEEIIAEGPDGDGKDLNPAAAACKTAFDSGPLAARTQRRWCQDHSLELPTADGCMEARARAGCWLHVRSKASRADTSHRARVCRLPSRCRRASRRREYHHRIRRNRRCTARQASR